jgi:hypothetical protein
VGVGPAYLLSSRLGVMCSDGEGARDEMIDDGWVALTEMSDEKRARRVAKGSSDVAIWVRFASV